MIIINAKIYKMTGDESTSVIENGYIKFDGGKITEIGAENPNGDTSESEIYDAHGGWLMPGFIDGHTHIGMLEDSLSFEGDDLNESSDPVLPQMRGIDSINPIDRCFIEAREGGITCVAAGPGSANPIGGQFAVIKTVGRRIDKMIVREPAAMKFALGENPKGCYHGKNQTPETRMATAALIREQLFKAVKYADAMDCAHDMSLDEEDRPDEPDYDIKNEALIPVIRGKLPVHFHAHRADDIFTAMRIAKEFSLDYVIIHCTEGHLIADELADENVRAFVGPNLCDRSKPELKELSFENPKVLDMAGVKIGLTTDHPVIPIQYLPLCASLAVKNGMDFYRALAAITINPAEILGISDRVGSLAVGKDADMVLFDGNPFEVMSSVKKVWIDGMQIK